MISTPLCTKTRSKIICYLLFYPYKKILLTNPVFYLEKSARFNTQFEQQYLVYYNIESQHSSIAVAFNGCYWLLQDRSYGFKIDGDMIFPQEHPVLVGLGTRLPLQLIFEKTMNIYHILIGSISLHLLSSTNHFLFLSLLCPQLEKLFATTGIWNQPRSMLNLYSGILGA